MLRFILLGVLIGVHAQAALITFDVGSYVGGYTILGQTSQVSGNQVVDLAAGTYIVQVGAHNQGRFNITVDGAGNVTSDNPLAAGAAGSTVTFNTTNLTIDPAAYSGGYFLVGVTGSLSGFQNLVVVPNLNYLVQVGNHNQGRFQVDIDTAGNASSTNPAAASTVGSVVTFNTTSLAIDPGAYLGEYFLLGVTSSLNGVQSIAVVPNLNYLIQVGGHNQGRFQVNIDASGGVISTNTAAAGTMASTVTLNSVEISVAPSDATPWVIRLVNSSISGPANVHIVPGLAYRFESSGQVDIIDIASPCGVSPNQLTQGATTFDLSCVLPPSFVCMKKTNYPVGGCSGQFIATSSVDLETYALDYGLEAGDYKHLKIDFDLSGTDIEIHSPCEIRIRKNRSIMADNICLDGRAAVKVNKNFSASGTTLTILSENGRAVVRRESNLVFDEILIEASTIAAIRRDSTVDASQSLELRSTGTGLSDSKAVIGVGSQVQASEMSLTSFAKSVVKKNAIVNADNLSVIASDKAILAAGSQVTLTGHLTLQSSGASGRAAIRKEASVQAASMSMSAVNKGHLGAQSVINIGGLLEFNASICKIKASAQITAGSQAGSCLAP